MQTSRPVSAPSLHASRRHHACQQHGASCRAGHDNHKRRPPRPSTACHVGHAPASAAMRRSTPAGLQAVSHVGHSTGIQTAPARPNGNVHGTGSMLGPLVPDPVGGVDDAGCSSLYLVTRSTQHAVRRRAEHVPRSTSSQLQQATLDVFVSDRLSGDAVVGATVIVADTESFSSGRVTNAGSTSAQSTKANAGGRVTCRILAHRQYVVTCRRCVHCHKLLRPDI